MIINLCVIIKFYINYITFIVKNPSKKHGML